MTVERLWYEASPYLYTVVGVATAADALSWLMKASGLILLAAALTILGLRWIYRHDEARSRERRLDSRRSVPLVAPARFDDGQALDPRRPGASRTR